MKVLKNDSRSNNAYITVSASIGHHRITINSIPATDEMIANVESIERAEAQIREDKYRLSQLISSAVKN